jgi:hypothetical protein
MSSVTLVSNGLPLPASPDYIAPLNAAPLRALEDGSAAKQLAAHGYVYLRGLLPRELVLAMRERYFARFPASFLKDGDRRRAAFSGQEPQGLPAHGTPGHPAYEFVREREFTDFAEHPLLRGAAAAVLGGAVERLRRTPVRHFVPGRPASSRAHIDGTYVEAAASDLVTLWVPLGDCPVESGGLVYLEDSHLEEGISERVRDLAPYDRPDDRRPLTHDLKWMSEHTQRRWLVTDYAAGDVVIHSPLIVHASLDCRSEEMRLSTDIRYLRQGSHYDPRWRGDWAANDTF